MVTWACRAHGRDEAVARAASGVDALENGEIVFTDWVVRDKVHSTLSLIKGFEQPDPTVRLLGHNVLDAEDEVAETKASLLAHLAMVDSLLTAANNYRHHLVHDENEHEEGGADAEQGPDKDLPDGSEHSGVDPVGAEMEDSSSGSSQETVRAAASCRLDL